MRYIKAYCYWLKSWGIHCLHYALCLFLFETNILRLSRFWIIVTHTKCKKKQHDSTMYFIHHSLPFVSSHSATDKKQLGGRQQFTLSFFNLTTLKTMWYPKLRYNILFTTVPTPWSFYMGPHFTLNMEPLVI